MSPGVLDFHRQATRLLEAEPPPRLEAFDRVITDGCAEALTVETEISRLRRRREAALESAGEDPRSDREIVEMGERLRELDARLEAIQEAIRALMSRRARQRLREFVDSRSAG